MVEPTRDEFIQLMNEIKTTLEIDKKDLTKQTPTFKLISSIMLERNEQANELQSLFAASLQTKRDVNELLPKWISEMGIFLSVLELGFEMGRRFERQSQEKETVY